MLIDDRSTGFRANPEIIASNIESYSTFIGLGVFTGVKKRFNPLRASCCSGVNACEKAFRYGNDPLIANCII
jgi:hypothetical protein